MKTKTNHLILVTNGHPETRPALEYGIWLAQMLEISVQVLGVCESDDKNHPVNALVEEMLPSIRAAGIPFQVEYLTGQAEEMVHRSVHEANTMIVIGPLGRPPLRRFFMGRTFRYFMEDLNIPILYVPKSRLPVRKILVCMGGLGYAIDVFHEALAIAVSLHAALTFLHVVEPITLDYPLAHEVEDHWQELLSTNTPQGNTLRQVLKESQEFEIQSAVRVRHGHIVPEILDEIEVEKYDLVCMGSMYSSHSLRHFTLPNITAEIAEIAGCPILTVRTRLED
ncbi:MAG: universal stress protein [Chloroflexota bacterium]